MAEQIPYGVATSLINKLASLAFREIGRVYGVADDLEKLRSTLESVKVVLSDAEQRQAEDPVIQHWVCRFKQVLHDAHDLLDDFVINDLRRKAVDRSKVRVFFSSQNQLVFRAKLARKIEKIRNKFNDVAEDMAKLNLNSSLEVLRQDEVVWRETGPSVLESEVIGRDDDKEKIIKLLKRTHEENQNVSLVAIVGMGGLGKTTLAQFVFNDVEVKSVFQNLIWVCVSDDFEAKTILKKMLEHLKRDAVSDLQVATLQEKLREELNGQRYMLVLDDVWNENNIKWEALRTPLMCGGQGSVILVTTRSTAVARTMGISNPYVLEGLTEEQSWALLKKVTFGEDLSKMRPNLASIGEEIAKKCRGVPLAVKTLGGLLKYRHEESEWRRILDGDVWRLCREEGSIMPVLKLSYHDLPFELRQCFAYCCLYPKDWTINRDELIHLWMSQGYLECSDESRSMKDVGNYYVQILLMRSFFQEPTFEEYGDIVYFKMHDLMHDLAISVAGNDYYLYSEGKGNIGRAIHISFLSRNDVHSLDSRHGSKLRTMVGRNIKDEFLTIPSIKLNLKYLRALNLSRSSITKLPEFIGESKHLRNLDLSYCRELISLPKAIENLVLLHTLNLTWCDKLVFDVEVITKLITLKYLYVYGCKAFEEKMPVGLGKMTSLECLSDFVVGDNVKGNSAKLNELRDLNLIREDLRISGLNLVEDVLSESQEANLKGKKHLRSLSLDWREETSYVGECINCDSLQLLENLCPHVSLRNLHVSGYPGVRFSSWISSLTNIVQISLYGFSNCEHLPPLERLPSLEKLVIEYMKELKCMHYEEISDVFFPSLKTLSIVYCRNLRGWERLGDDIHGNYMHNNISLPSFPTLSRLRIDTCPNLTCMPTFPHLNEGLVLEKCSVKPMIKTCLVQLEDSSFRPLSSLGRLVIEHVTETEDITKECMQNLTSLTFLSFKGSNLLPHMQHINSELQELYISEVDVDKFELWKSEGGDGTQCHEPPPALRSLQRLTIASCDNLKSLSEAIRCLTNLQFLKIDRCRKLESLPEAIGCFTNLQALWIFGCPLLHDRCQVETGQDWPKIAHIPDRHIS